MTSCQRQNSCKAENLPKISNKQTRIRAFLGVSILVVWGWVLGGCAAGVSASKPPSAPSTPKTALNVTPMNASFGSVPVGTASSQTIQLSNTGAAILTVSQISVAGSGYSTGNMSFPMALNPGQASTFNIQYLPTTVGSATGNVSVVSTAANSPATIILSGTGVTATQTLSLSTTNLSFGSVNTGISSTLGITVTNSGNANVTVSQIAAGGAGFSLTGAAVPVTLSASQNLTFEVIFDPATAGNATGSVALTSNAAGPPSTISLSGIGVQPAPHSVMLGWTPSTSTVAGYNVYRSIVSGTAYTKISSEVVVAAAYQDPNVQSGTTYFYVTRAEDSSGNESANSNEASAFIP